VERGDEALAVIGRSYKVSGRRLARLS